MRLESLAMGGITAAVIGFIVVIFFYLARSAEERRFLLPLALASFTLKATLVPIYYSVLMATGWDGFAYYDSLAYHEDGMEVAAEFARGLDYRSRAWTTTDPGFPIVTGVIYWMFGPNTLIIRMINAVLSVFTLLYVYRIGRTLIPEDVRVARYACYLTAFLPFSMAIVINHRKEPLVVLVTTFLVYHAIRLVRTERNWPMDIPWLIGGVIVLSFIRSGYVFPFLGTVLISFFFAQRSILNALALSSVAIVVFAGAQFAITDETSTSVAASSERFRGKLEMSADRADQGGLVRMLRITSPRGLYKLPAATVMAAVLPFPPYFRGSLPSMLLSWANLANLVFLPAMIYGALTVLRRDDWHKCVPIVFFPAFFLVVHGLVNIGIARYRETIFPTMLILAGIGLAQRGGRVVYGLVYAGLILLGGVAYFVRY